MGLAGVLLFLVQPMLAKFILPWFGGSATTWTVCMLFFQAALLLGYAYAYAITRPLSLTAQAVMQIALVGLACLCLPVTPAAAFKPLDAADPTGRILALLTVCVGAPYAVLATTSPMLQRWLGQVEPGLLASRFFAVSNLGSFLGLLSYPFVVEPFLPSPEQTALWSIGFCLFALLSAGSAVVVLWRRKPAPNSPDDPPDQAARPVGTWWWLVYSALGSVLLLATTNRITQWSAVIPFLWILPLSVYLLTFVLCFGHQVGGRRRSFLLAFVAMAALCGVLARPELPVDLLVQVGLQCLTLFFGCMICHGEIVRLQPPARRLPRFYLVIALGGAVGGAFVTLAAPLLFADYWEHPLAIVVIAVVAWLADAKAVFVRPFAWWKAGMAATLALFFVGIGAGGRAEWANDAVTVARARNFYGVVRVYQEDMDDPEEYSLVMQQAGVDQGSQYQAADRRREPSCAFDERHGLGLALRFQQRRRHGDPAAPLRIGVIGLGAGMVAALGKPGDTLRYYELNPAVTELAHRYFTFLADSPARNRGPAWRRPHSARARGRGRTDRPLRRAYHRCLPRRGTAHAPDDQRGLRGLPPPSGARRHPGHQFRTRHLRTGAASPRPGSGPGTRRPLVREPRGNRLRRPGELGALYARCGLVGGAGSQGGHFAVARPFGPPARVDGRQQQSAERDQLGRGRRRAMSRRWTATDPCGPAQSACAPGRARRSARRPAARRRRREPGLGRRQTAIFSWQVPSVRVRMVVSKIDHAATADAGGELGTYLEVCRIGV